ncbi:phenylalanine--tRNA ligase subunit beta [Aureibacillus halotolerans]|uniref:Phenylalanine--tRNA ligase beta subunit n=1 Tax=Aureibacillus halotolerans TaxID=1508390 RepID=A0A4R6TZU5_9BACI|nr:phenylalanine--tRNA ligase subunit beta [Aureibacillus halotolerans]TDQ39171.1 phenylalanyl-tRNA synthetase beta subunit [Aureibacillus halotolerans]
MLVSYEWLNDYVNTKQTTAEELAEKITRTGIEVEHVDRMAASLDKVVVGYVEQCHPHPDADKLNLCQVNTGRETVQIVCGAKNVAAGQHVVVAQPGAKLPGGIKIKKAKLRGEVSEGMICSLSELGVPQALVPKEVADGIYVFTEDVDSGTPAAKALKLDDAIIELGLTPNRSDCLSILGTAYETAAILNTDVKWPDESVEESDLATSDAISVTVEATADNPYYSARILENVTIAPSPFWLQRRLISAGIRPINNVVDITNYVLLEYGQPLHAFDYDKLDSKEIVVRHAKANESLITLDGQTRTLMEGELVITNGEQPIAIAGVMGGQSTEVTPQTTTILLEAAYFAPITVRATSKAHGLRSESSARFEKGVDPVRTKKASERAAHLLQKYANATVRQGIVSQENELPKEQIVKVTVSHANALLGTDISADAIAATFVALQFPYTQDGEAFAVQVPTRRPDITLAQDLIEEIGRLYGYDRIPATLPATLPKQFGLTDKQKAVRKARRVLEEAGLNEAITYSLTSKKKATQFSLYKDVQTIAIAMPMSEERHYLRQSLLPHLLEAAAYNQHRKVTKRALYEISSVYTTVDGPENYKEHLHIAGVLSGITTEQSWQHAKQTVDFYEAKGIVELLLNELHINGDVSFHADRQPDLHPGRTAAISVDGEVIGVVAQLHPFAAAEQDLEETYVFELMTTGWLGKEKEDEYTGVPRFPAMSRDIAVVVDQKVASGEIQKAILTAGGSLLQKAKLFDVYEGDKLPEGKKSLAYSLLYSAPERTLTDEEVTAANDNVLTKLKETFGAELRS